MSLFFGNRGVPEIASGDVFRKIGTYGADWVVERLFDYPDIPRHARLIDQGSGRTMTVAVSMLLDPEMFKPIRK
ncbi:hypothetical protein CU669_11995 [Paramagnetospirillum kuznetsovii]|uniref:Uncharacterized protein n=1 Tax=Paramagnetospirillum kuznetsovii TaxID=2053833 RepID=A0A364NX67_9PROT|nr:hypothetical protein [Paramagnetospirillum kuznetsovii]RAU21691.1 hypothetical protein CU669_11995 [Paramagnetospirillum kuznetsovii]